MEDFSTILYLLIAGGLGILSYVTQSREAKRRKARNVDGPAMPPFGTAFGDEPDNSEGDVSDDASGDPFGRQQPETGKTYKARGLDGQSVVGADRRHGGRAGCHEINSGIPGGRTGTFTTAATGADAESICGDEVLTYESVTGYQALTAAVEYSRIQSNAVEEPHNKLIVVGEQEDAQRVEAPVFADSDSATLAKAFDLRKAVVWSEILKPKFDEE